MNNPTKTFWEHQLFSINHIKIEQFAIKEGYWFPSVQWIGNTPHKIQPKYEKEITYTPNLFPHLMVHNTVVWGQITELTGLPFIS